MTAQSSLTTALALCQEPQATAEWWSSLDGLLVDGFTTRAEAVEAIAEAVRLRYLSRSWDFAAADHAINMLAGYAQREGVMPENFWRIYLTFDEGEVAAVDESVLRARLSRLGDQDTQDGCPGR